MGIPEETALRVKSEITPLFDDLKKHIDFFKSQKPCLGENCPNAKAIEELKQLRPRLEALENEVKIKIPKPKEEKLISMDEALRIALDDIIERKEASPYYEILSKRKELLFEKEKRGGEEKAKKSVWC